MLGMAEGVGDGLLAMVLTVVVVGEELLAMPLMVDGVVDGLLATM